MATETNPAKPAKGKASVRSLVITLFTIVFATIAIAVAAVRDRRAASRGDLPLEAQFAGCADVVVEKDVVCVLDAARAVRVAVPAPASELNVVAVGASGGASPERVTEEHAGWSLLRLVLPQGTRELVVSRAASAANARRSSYRLVVRVEPALPRIEAANRARNQGHFEEARASANAALASSDAHERALAQGVLGRIALREGDIETAQRHLRESVAAHTATGRIGARTEDAFALAFLLSQRSRRLTEARSVLDALEPELAIYPEGAARLPLYRANLAIALGDARGALEAARKARVLSERLGLRGAARRASLGEANHLATVGELEGARALLAEHRRILDAASDATACEKAEHASVVADVERLARRPDDEIRAAERVLSLTEHDCPDATMRTAALTTLAAAAADAKQHVQARELIARARAAMKTPRVPERILWEDIEGRIALATEHAKEALVSFDREAALAAQASLPASAWQAAIGRGRALEAYGDLDGAEKAYRDAEALLSRHVLEIPLGEGRGVLLAGKAESAGRLVDLLVRRDRADDALTAIRIARARDLEALSRSHRLRALPPAAAEAWDTAMAHYADLRRAIDDDAAGDWSRSDTERAARADARLEKTAEAHATLDHALALVGGGHDAASFAPARLREGDAVLATMTTLTRTVAIVANTTAARAFTIVPPSSFATARDRERWAEVLFNPARDALLAARRVLVLTTGAARDVPIQALPFEGGPLLAHALVVHPLDLGASADAPRMSAPSVLVVSDPSGDLAGAHAEGDETARLLAGSAVVHLAGERASAPELRKRLGAVDLFHFAGHASFGGRDGIDSALWLGDGARFEVGDVMGLGRAPARVVLDACEAGRGDAAAPGVGFGIAQAFVANGSAVVLAPTRTVPDRTGMVLARALYPSFAQAPTEEAIAIARAALLALAKSAPVDWDAFRIFVP